MLNYGYRRLQVRVGLETFRAFATYDLHVVELARTLTHRSVPRS